jgi:beta-phosphoglucomutase-like phosphatase (HAD superfamily)
MKPQAILFDFDGVLIDSEWAGNSFIANWLTEAGFPTSPEQAIEHFMGTGGKSFEAAIERWTGAPFPAALQDARFGLGRAMLEEGIVEVVGAKAFIAGLPGDFPIAVTSSASTRWLAGHLDHLGLRDRFGDHIYSGREHVERMKPAPDLYLFAADRLGVAIAETLIVEDSPVGIEGAVASGAHVVGLLAGSHIREGHDARLLAAGAHRCVAGFEEIAALYF